MRKTYSNIDFGRKEKTGSSGRDQRDDRRSSWDTEKEEPRDDEQLAVLDK